MAIRYDSQLSQQIRKAVKSFNAKVRRLESKGVSAALLPDKISTKEIKAGIRSRSDLRTRLSQLQDFSSGGDVFTSQGGLIGTPTLFQYRQGEANKAIKELNKEYQKVIRMNTQAPMMQSEYTANLKAKMDYLSRDIQGLDVRQVQIFNKNLLTPEQRGIKDETFYNNYLKMLFYNAYRGDLSPELVRSIMDKISKIPPSKLLELYGTDPAFRAVQDRYMMNKNDAYASDEDKETKDKYEYLNQRAAEVIEELNK